MWPAASIAADNAVPQSGRAQLLDTAFPRNFGGGRLDGSTAFSKDGEKIHSHFFGQSSFAEYMLCHQRSVVKVPKDIPLEKLAPLGCGITTGAGTVLNTFQLKAGESFVVFGAGAVGLAAILAAKALGASVIIAVGRNVTKMNMAKEFGATHILDGNHANTAEEVRQILPGGMRYALDTTGNPKIIEKAIACLGTVAKPHFAACRSRPSQFPSISSIS